MGPRSLAVLIRVVGVDAARGLAQRAAATPRRRDSPWAAGRARCFPRRSLLRRPHARPFASRRRVVRRAVVVEQLAGLLLAGVDGLILQFLTIGDPDTAGKSAVAVGPARAIAAAGPTRCSSQRPAAESANSTRRRIRSQPRSQAACVSGDGWSRTSAAQRWSASPTA